ncbi:hypothetical protein D1872_267900 [compost metagenome]
MDEPIERGTVMENAFLQPRYRSDALGMGIMPYSSFEGWQCVISEIVSVQSVHPFQQQLDFDQFPLFFLRHI